MEVLTNLTAALFANAVPYTRSDDVEKNIEPSIKQELEELANSSNKSTLPYDLAYNIASWELLSNPMERFKWRKVLLQAQKACTVQNQDDDNYRKEVAPITTNLEWSRSFWDGRGTVSPKSSETNSADDIPVPVKAVQAVNRAVACHPLMGGVSTPGQGLEELLSVSSDLKTPTQKRILCYNLAVLQLCANKLDDCRSSCQLLLSSMEILSKTKRKAKAEW